MKRMKHLFALLLLSSLAVGLYSCSDDDDEGGQVSTSAGVLDEKSGLRVKSYDNYTFYYDDNGRVDYISDGSDGSYEFQYNPNKIAYTDKFDHYEETVGYNGSGFLVSTNYSASDEDWSESSQASLSYDSNGHLTKISGSGKESETGYGERYSNTWSFTYSLTWRNNQLQQVVINFNEKEVEDGETEDGSWGETWTFSYDNDSYENAYRQWAPSIGQSLENEGIVEILAYIGLLGVGPTMLPSSSEMSAEEHYGGRLYTSDHSYTYRYGFNNDGSISYTMVDNSSYNFSYDYAEASTTRSEAGPQSVSEKNLASRLGRMFRHSRRHQ